MNLLYVTHAGREVIVNISLCEGIELEDGTLLFYMGSRTRAFELGKQVTHQKLMRTIREALAPASEGRMNTVLGIAMYLNLDAL